MNRDQTSLQNLNDIVVSQDVPWWPLAPGWYVLAVLLVGLLVFLGFRNWQKRKANRYRELALRELSGIRQQADPAALQKLPALLKRAALSAWPRGDVAALSGADWHSFLDRTAKMDHFSSGAGELLDQLAYGGGKGMPAGDAGFDSVMEAAEYWLRRHSAESADG